MPILLEILFIALLVGVLITNFKGFLKALPYFIALVLLAVILGACVLLWR